MDMAAILVASWCLRKPLPTNCMTLFKVGKYLFLTENLRVFAGSEASWCVVFGRYFRTEMLAICPFVSRHLRPFNRAVRTTKRSSAAPSAGLRCN